MRLPKPQSGRRRAIVVIAGALLLGTPVLASARLRAKLLRAATSGSLTTQPSEPLNDLATIRALLARIRGTNAFACEMAMASIDHGNWFGGVGSNPFVDDSARLDVPHELDDSALEPVWAALRDADPCVRRTAASLLGRAHSPQASARLRSTLNDPQAEQRTLAAFALGLAEDLAAGARLHALLHDTSPTVRATAAWALGEIEYRAAIEALAELLVRDPSRQVRRAAARALGQIAG